MKRLVLLVAVTVAVAAALTFGQRDPAPVDQPDLGPLRAAAALAPCPAGVGDLPELTLPCLGGGPAVPLHGPPTGVPTLVNIYGSWCAPCQDEMPVLVAFAARAGDKVALLGIDTQDTAVAALNFAKDFGQHWPAVVDDEGTVLRRYSPGPPVTLFVDEGGRVTFVHRGRFASVAQLASAVQQHLGVRV